jgi:hypothetical protein
MLEIVALILLTRHIGKIAQKKGLKPGTWKLYTVLCWIAGEITGMIIAMLLFGDDIVSIILTAIAGAVGGYLILKSVLEKKPDTVEDDINKIGTDDLRP